MSEDMLPSIEDLGEDFQKYMEVDMEKSGENYLRAFAEKHFQDIPRDRQLKILTDAGNIIDGDEEISLDWFADSLVGAFLLHQEGIEEAKAYLQKEFGDLLTIDG